MPAIADNAVEGLIPDCWLELALTAIANLDPGVIMNMLHDNGDGTVTAKLYNRNELDASQKVAKVTVKTTRTRMLFGFRLFKMGCSCF
jgi:hypothetical protein